MYSTPTDYLAVLLTLALTVVFGLVAVVVAVRLGMRAAAPDAPPRSWVRAWVGPVLVGGVAVLAAVSVAFQGGTVARTPPPRWAAPPPPPQERTQSAEWRAWRAQLHDALATDPPPTEPAVIDALRLKPPAVTDPYTEADQLRRDSAVADVLLSYKPVRDLLRTRFGIRDTFLGTGLSQPLGATPYAAASVHEYLVPNLRDTHEHVWTWKFTTLGENVSLPLKSVLGGTEKERTLPTVEKPTAPGEKTSAERFESDLQVIRQRAANPDHPIPPMIRFARFNEKFYENTVGRPAAQRVFFSNLAEVWNLSIQDAAEKSGYHYRGKEGDGEVLFVWVYVPYQSNEFTPATWRNVFSKLPEWLEEAR